MNKAIPAFSVEQVAEAFPFLTPAEKVEVLGILQSKRGWMPLPGPQSDAFHSEADITGYGGAAGGGKTDLATGLATTVHHRSIIYRREAAQLTAIVDRLEELVGDRVGYNGSSGIWRLGRKRQIEFGGFPNLGDEKRYQGRGHDLKVFDEVTEMLELQVRFLMGWLRSAREGRQRILMTFNPPTTPEGRWVITFFAPWLDKRFPGVKAEPGELRWATTIGGEDRWLPDARPFVLVDGQIVYEFDAAKVPPDQIIRPLSRTFIPARVTDNPHYLKSGYLAKLQALPEPLRSQMLNGDFEAGMEDDAWQVIPTAWVRASMDRWNARKSDSIAFRKGVMDSMGVDVARGGRDEFIIARRHGRWFADLLCYPGVQVPTGAIGAGLVIQHRRDRAPVHVDIVGWGSDVHGALVDNAIQTVAINGANSSFKQTKQAGQRFFNKRAELIWGLREALDPDGPDPIDLPDDTKLELDLTAYRWESTRSGIKIEGKPEMIKRLGRSPDRGDAVAMALEDTLKDEVVIDALAAMSHNGGDEYDRMTI